MRKLVLIVALFGAACGSSPSRALAPTTPVAPVVPACQANHTATMAFRNNGSRTIDVILDGGVLGNLSPGASGLERTVAANVAHDIKFKITNTSTFPCAAFNPIPIECGSQTYGSCTGF